MLLTTIHKNIIIDMVMHEKCILLLDFFYPWQRTGIFASKKNISNIKKKNISNIGSAIEEKIDVL